MANLLEKAFSTPSPKKPKRNLLEAAFADDTPTGNRYVQRSGIREGELKPRFERKGTLGEKAEELAAFGKGIAAPLASIPLVGARAQYGAQEAALQTLAGQAEARGNYDLATALRKELEKNAALREQNPEMAVIQPESVDRYNRAQTFGESAKAFASDPVGVGSTLFGGMMGGFGTSAVAGGGLALKDAIRNITSPASPESIKARMDASAAGLPSDPVLANLWRVVSGTAYGGAKDAIIGQRMMAKAAENGFDPTSAKSLKAFVESDKGQAELKQIEPIADVEAKAQAAGLLAGPVGGKVAGKVLGKVAPKVVQALTPEIVSGIGTGAGMSGTMLAGREITSQMPGGEPVTGAEVFNYGLLGTLPALHAALGKKGSGPTPPPDKGNGKVVGIIPKPPEQPQPIENQPVSLAPINPSANPLAPSPIESRPKPSIQEKPRVFPKPAWAESKVRGIVEAPKAAEVPTEAAQAPSVAAPASKSPALSGDDLTRMAFPQLRAEAKRQGVATKGMKRADLETGIREARARAENESNFLLPKTRAILGDNVFELTGYSDGGMQIDALNVQTGETASFRRPAWEAGVKVQRSTPPEVEKKILDAGRERSRLALEEQNKADSYTLGYLDELRNNLQYEIDRLGSESSGPELDDLRSRLSVVESKIFSIHQQATLKEIAKHPSIVRQMPWPEHPTLDDVLRIRDSRIKEEVALFREQIGLNRKEAEHLQALMAEEKSIEKFKKSLAPEKAEAVDQFFDKSPWNKPGAPFEWWEYSKNYDPSELEAITGANPDDKLYLVRAWASALYGRGMKMDRSSDRYIFALGAMRKLKGIGGTIQDIARGVDKFSTAVSGSMSDKVEATKSVAVKMSEFARKHGVEFETTKEYGERGSNVGNASLKEIAIDTNVAEPPQKGVIQPQPEMKGSDLRGKAEAQADEGNQGRQEGVLAPPPPGIGPAPRAEEPVVEKAATQPEQALKPETLIEPSGKVVEGRWVANDIRPEYMPLDEIVDSPDVPQWKSKTDPLTPPYDPAQGGPITIWERLNGRKEVITGRHRLDVARRTPGRKQIMVQVFREADGFDKRMARTWDVESNIKSGHGSIEDYADYFRHNEYTEAEARARGMLDREKGKQGYELGTNASDEVYAAFRNGEVDAARSRAIAVAAPKNSDVQLAALEFYRGDKSMSANSLLNVTRNIARNPRAIQTGGNRVRGKDATGDIFGLDTRFIEEQRALVDASNGLRKEWANERGILERAMSLTKRQDRQRLAKQSGISVDINDPVKVKARITELDNLIERLKDWGDKRDVAQMVYDRAGMKPGEYDLPGEGEKQAPPPVVEQDMFSEPRASADPSAPMDAKPIGMGLSKRMGRGKKQSGFIGVPDPMAALAKLTNLLKDAKTKPGEPRVREAFDLAQRASGAKDALGRGLDGLRMAGRYMVALQEGKPVWNNLKDAVGKRQLALSESAANARKWMDQVGAAFPDERLQEAISDWVDTGGDKVTLERALAETSRPYKKGYERALALTPEEIEHAQKIQGYFAERLKEAEDAGILEDGVANYIHRMYLKDNNWKQSVLAELSSGIFTGKPGLAMKRFFQYDFEAERAGRNPVKSFIKRIVAYDMALNESIANREMAKRFMDAKMPDGKPAIEMSGVGVPIEGKPKDALLVYPKRKRADRAITADGRPYIPFDHPALRKWVWADTDKNWKTTFVQGSALVHPDALKQVKAVFGKSALRQIPVVRAAMNVSSTIKGTMLDLSGFHPVQIGVHAIEHRTFKPVKEIDFADPTQRSLISHGLVVGETHGYQMFSEGLSGTSLTRHLPFGIGEKLQAYNDWLFQSYIPRIKMAMALHALERNTAKYSKKLSHDEILHLTAMESNQAFGELNYEMMGRNKTFQDFLRLSMLAPDFLEARAKFVGQAATRFGGEQFVALAGGAAALYVTARIINKLLDDQYHFEPNNAFSIVYKGRAWSLRTIQGDLIHLATDPAKFLYNRVNPTTVRPLVEAGTGRDYFGRKRDLGEQLKDYLSTPLPISMRGLFGGSEQKLWESLANSLGVTVRRESASSDIYKLAQKWMDKRGLSRSETIYDPEKDPYREIKNAARYGETTDVAQAVGKAVESGKISYKQLMDYTRDYGRRPFTGSRPLDFEFENSLSTDEKATLRAAQKELLDVQQMMWSGMALYEREKAKDKTVLPSSSLEQNKSSASPKRTLLDKAFSE